MPTDSPPALTQADCDDLAAAYAALDELADLDGRPRPERARPVLGGLVAWAHAPEATPSPLPHDNSRRTRKVDGFVERGAWPVGLLPVREITVDAVARGLSYSRGLGYLVNSDRVSVDAAARLLADVLDDAATALPEPDPLAALNDHASELERASRDARLTACDDEERQAMPDGLSVPRWARLLDWTGPSRRAASRWRAEMRPTSLETRHDRAGWRHGLRATAAELRTSTAARRALLGAVRERLPGPAPLVDPDAASAWLATFDRETAVRRSSLVRAYSEAGAPGDLTPTALRAAAEARWGTPVTRRGHITYRPAHKDAT